MEALSGLNQRSLQAALFQLDETCDEWVVNESAEMIMSDQPGFDDWWVEEPGFYITRPKLQGPGMLPHGSAGWRLLSRRL